MGCGHSSALPGYVLARRSDFISPQLASQLQNDPSEPGSPKSFAKSDFVLRDIIGKGGKSVGVQVGFHPASSRYYAIKIISERLAQAQHWEVQPEQERDVLEETAKAKCPFIVPYKGFYEDGTDMCLVMAYMPGGELFSRMRGRRMCLDEAVFYAAEILLAVESLHKLGYIYRDLKPENVLLDDEGHAYLCDMGFAIKAARAYRRVGTPQYQAPELLAENVATVGYTKAVDWWAFGCMVFEMLVGYPAWGPNDSTPEQVYAHILAGRLDLPSFLPAVAVLLIRSLLQLDPAKRVATPEEIKSAPFFGAVNWQAMEASQYLAPWVPPPLRFPGDCVNFDLYLSREGQTVVARGAAARYVYELPVPPQPAPEIHLPLQAQPDPQPQLSAQPLPPQPVSEPAASPTTPSDAAAAGTATETNRNPTTVASKGEHQNNSQVAQPASS